jgi:hypothetical protein
MQAQAQAITIPLFNQVTGNTWRSVRSYNSHETAQYIASAIQKAYHAQVSAIQHSMPDVYAVVPMHIDWDFINKVLIRYPDVFKADYSYGCISRTTYASYIGAAQAAMEFKGLMSYIRIPQRVSFLYSDTDPRTWVRR